VADIRIPANEIDPQVVRQIEGRLRDLILRGNRVIEVELEDIGSLNPSLVAMLLRVQRRLTWRNGRLLVVASEETRRTLDRMGLAESLEVVDPRHQSAES
jgi:anti-anti-sigma regulatory factor